MALDPAAVGARTKPYVHAYDWKRLALYALGIGTKRDELRYLYEGSAGGLAAHPTYAVVPAFEPVLDLLRLSQVDFAMVVHGAQKVTAHRALPSAGELVTVGVLDGIYDLKRFAQLAIRTESHLGGELVFATTWSIIVRGGGGFGGPRPPADDAPSVPKDRPADWVVEEATSPEQALLYRLNGDLNPLHADPEFAREVGFAEGPILHGLCTYGFVARAITRQAADGDAGRLRALSAQFRRPVWPGDSLVTSGWALGDGRWAVTASVKGRPEPVVSNAWAEVAPSSSADGAPPR